MKPKSSIRCFLALTGCSLLAISYSHAQTILADSYLTSLNVGSPTTLYATPAFPSFLDGPLTGSSNLTLTGSFTAQPNNTNGVLSLVGNAGNTFNGNITVNSGILRIAGSPFASNGGFVAGSMTSANTITINRAGVLTIDDNVAGGYTANRFGTVGQRPDIDLAGGTINLLGLNNASSSVQTFGALTSSSGQGTVNVTRNSSGNPTLTFDSLAINSGSLLTFNGTNLGTGTNDARITFTTAPTMINGIIAGARFAANSADTNSTFVTYGANGVRAFTASDFTIYAANDINGATFDQNAQMTGAVGPVTLTSDVAVNSLNYNGGPASNHVWSLGGNKLTLTSGMFLRNGTNQQLTINNGTLTAGNGTDAIDLNITTAQQNVIIDAVIANNASSVVTLVKSGDTRNLTLSGGVDNTYSGGTYVVGGQLNTGSVANRAYLGTGKVTVDGASILQLLAIGATSNASGDDFTAINSGQINISNNNHGSVDTFNIGAYSTISGASGSGTGLASLTRGTNITLAENAIIGHNALTAALNLTTGTIQNLGTNADLYYGLAQSQGNAGGSIEIGNGTAFKGISGRRTGNIEWNNGTINVASGTTDLYFRSMGGTELQSPDVFTLGNGASAGGIVIDVADAGTLNVNLSGRFTINEAEAAFGNSSTGRHVRFVVGAGSDLGMGASGMGSGTGIASALVQNGGFIRFGQGVTATNAFNGAVTVEAGGRFDASLAGGLTGIGALTFNEGSILNIATSATSFSGSQAIAANIAAGTIVRLSVNNFGAAGETLDSVLGSGAKSVTFQIAGGNNAVNPTASGTAVYTLNKSAGGVGGVLTNDLTARTVNNLTNGHIALGANGGVIAATTGTTFTISENITGAGSLTAGTSTIIDGAPKEGIVSLNTANDYTGGTIVDAGTLTMGNAAALGSNSGQLTVNGGTLNMNNNSLTVGNLTGIGGVISGTSGNRTLTIGQGDNGGGNFQGVIANGSGGTTALTKTGTGTITLSGDNTYTGATTIDGGSLLVNGTHTSTVASTNYAVNANSTLGGTGRLAVNGNVSVASTGILAPGASIGTLTLDGLNTTGAVLTMTTGSKFGFELNGSGGTPDQLAFWNYLGGDLGLNDNSIDLSLLGTQTPGTYSVDIFSFFSDSGSTAATHAFSSGLTIGSLGTGIESASIDWDGTGDNNQTIALTYTVIPEPRAALLGGLGLLMLLRRRRP